MRLSTIALSFMLAVSQWYKNRLGVLENTLFPTFSVRSKNAKDLMLVMVGKEWTQEMCTFVQQNGLGDSIIKATEVSNEDLRALYSSARLLLFPSLQEGFGWPIIEANACGCPVATSNRAPMTEVAGDAAIYVDPDQSQAAAEIIADALKNRGGLREASLRNAERFQTSRMIHAYVELDRSRIEKRAIEEVTDDKLDGELIEDAIEK